jgi:hypothetical protein
MFHRRSITTGIAGTSTITAFAGLASRVPDQMKVAKSARRDAGLFA